MKTLLIAACLSLGVAHAARPTVTPFTGTTLKGQNFDLKALQGQRVILTFFATWCKPCKKAIPLFEEMAEKDGKTQVVAVSIDDAQTQSRVRGLVKKKKWKSTIIIDADGKIAASLNPRGLAPLTLVLDEQGGLALSLEGFNPGDDEKVAKVLADLQAEANVAVPPPTEPAAADTPKVEEATP